MTDAPLERGLMFKDRLVRALLAGRKSQKEWGAQFDIDVFAPERYWLLP